VDDRGPSLIGDARPSSVGRRLGPEGRSGTGSGMTGKSGKQIERCVISTFQVAEGMGFKGDFRQWEHLLRVGDCV
jgi:hypothetical protein